MTLYDYYYWIDYLFIPKNAIGLISSFDLFYFVSRNITTISVIFFFQGDDLWDP